MIDRGDGHKSTPKEGSPHHALKVLALTRFDRAGAGSRVRFMEFAPELERRGIEVDFSPLFDSCYLENLYRDGTRSFNYLVVRYMRRLMSLVLSKRYDVLWLQNEFFPMFPAISERLASVLGRRLVVDYDDATFHSYDLHRHLLVRGLLGGKIDAVMRSAEIVVAGNRYIAERASAAGARRVEIIPTGVDMSRYQPRWTHPNDVKATQEVTLGWIGSPVTAHYLKAITGPIARIQAECGMGVRLVGSGPMELPGVDAELLAWTEGEEAGAVASFDIGVMPLTDGPWERGKCGYKLIQYMACGLPVVASSVGANSEIVEDGVSGFLVSDDDGWIRALRKLAADPELRWRMGMAGRRRAEELYSTTVLATRLAAVLHSAAG